jgi:flagellar hook assembly protein FlgD
LDAGDQAMTWDGRDQRGTVVPSGLYFVELRHGQQRQTLRVIVAR